MFQGKVLREKFAGFETAVAEVIADFAAQGILKADEVAAIGHRVVHGGDKFSSPVLINEAVLTAVRELSVFAPLHNPANLAGIEACLKLFSVPQVAVFDTAFHQSMAAAQYTYAIPAALTKRYGIRRYGFHGTSHEYVTRECARQMGVPYSEFNAISLHLGNGASVCCVRGGKSIDTSMGFTPLEGLVMGTRSGDIDPAMVLFLQSAEKLSPEEADNLLNKKSGLLGLCDTSDMREILERADGGDSKAALAIDVFCARVRKYLGAYLTYGKPDALIFTGGIGENAALIREKICANLEHLSLAPVLVIPTDEERMIAMATWRHLG